MQRMNRMSGFNTKVGHTAIAACAALALAAGLGSGACIPVTPDLSPPDPSGPVSYSFDIQPIFDKRCVVCHRPGGIGETVARVDMLLTSGTSYRDLVNQPSSKWPGWVLVVPGDAEGSLLYRKVTEAPPVGPRMPLLMPPLSDTEIELIREWIEAGAPQN